MVFHEVFVRSGETVVFVVIDVRVTLITHIDYNNKLIISETHFHHLGQEEGRMSSQNNKIAISQLWMTFYSK